MTSMAEEMRGVGSLGWADKLPGELGKQPKAGQLLSLQLLISLCAFLCSLLSFAVLGKVLRTSGSSVSGANSKDFVQGHPNLPEI